MAHKYTKSFDDVAIGSKRKQILKEQNDKCNRCGLSHWLSEKLILELEHRDGDNQNHTRENLECLCPNCHSLTPTWRGRNISAKKNISDEQMIASLKDTKSIGKTLRFFGMADKGKNYERMNRLVSENNIEMIYDKTNTHKLNREEFDYMIALFLNGSSMLKIARDMKLNKATVRSAIKGETYKHFHDEDTMMEDGSRLELEHDGY